MITDAVCDNKRWWDIQWLYLNYTIYLTTAFLRKRIISNTLFYIYSKSQVGLCCFPVALIHIRPPCFASFLAVPNKWRLYMQSIWLFRDRAPYKQTQMTFSSTPPLFSHCFLIGFLNGVWPTATPCFHTKRSVCLSIFITSGCGGSSSVWRFCCLMQMF